MNLTCPQCENTDQAKIAGNEVRGVYDGVLFWTCMNCGHNWTAWPPPGRRYDAAMEMIATIDKQREAVQ